MQTFRKRIGVGLGFAIVAGGILAAPTPALANPAGTSLVINEVYGGGGNSGGVYRSDFIELYNPTNAPISLSGMSVQYRSSSGGAGGAAVALSGSVKAKGYFLIKAADGTATTQPALPTPDATTTFTLSGTAGQILLIKGSSFTGTGNVASNAGLVDMVAYGTGNTYEGAAGPGTSNSTSVTRTNGVDTDNNSADFKTATPVAQNSASTGTDPDPEPGADKTIAEIQGTNTATSPLAGQQVITDGVVTAAYPSGGFNGFYLQTAGTGSGTDATPGASDAVFVYGGTGLAAASYPAVGDHVEVTGAVSEFMGTTEITVTGASAVVAVPGAVTPVTPLAAAYPTTEAAREAHEGELLAPTGAFTVTDSYGTNQYAEIGLATGDHPLIQPTDVAEAGTPAAATVAENNIARGVVLDDGASINFLSGASRNIALPYLTNPAGQPVPVRVGAPVTFDQPVILEYRNSLWKFQPRGQLTAAGTPPVSIENTRTPAPENVPGDLRIATFNVLNYFNTTGEAFVAAGGSCTYYTDREGNRVANNACTPDGPRGAAQDDDFQRQQTKIVAAINKLGADVISLEEIENSVKLIGETNRDDAVAELVDALNTAAGSEVWAYAPSPSAANLPPTGEQDVIRNAFIYKPATTSLVGASQVLVGSAAFDNAREPLAQAFKPTGSPDTAAFAVITNHFKSKGSGADDGTGQGLSNPDRVAQAHALADFADTFAASRNTDKVFLAGDFNSYTEEDPMQVLYDEGYANVESDTPGEASYSFDGLSGSLDHILASPAALETVEGADIWSINSGEALAFEYSRHNYNLTNFYQSGPYRSSDHDPRIVGISTEPVGAAPFDLTLLGVNDFHGRINANTVKWAGTVEQLRTEAGAADTLFIGAGDLIGASEFASATQQDQPTIDVMNALGLDASAVGNHEFDQGWVDLRDRVIGPEGDRNALWDYLGANVYAKGTNDPVLPEYALYEKHGVKIAVVGAVTEETASLVSPGGITDIDFGDPVAAVNRVAGELSDGNAANGEADVIVATFHAGATQGVGSNYAAQVAKGGEFADMANLDPQVDAIFNGHTHQVYAWDAPVPGAPGKSRPILQTGEYGSNVGVIKLTINPDTKAVTTYTSRNVARTTTADSALVSAYPRVAEVKTIVDAAVAHAAEVGNEPVGRITADITTAFTGTARDDRASESALGDLVGNALRDGIPADIGDADIGIVNPGGLRDELLYAGNTASNPANTDGVVTYAEANAVLPFVNNIWLVDLTGAELKQVLEQQWQPTGSSRPFLALGLSDNVRVTQDPTKPAGSRITSVRINDALVDPSATYTVSTFSFLGTGGDNFTAFTQGDPRDTGLVDRDLWIQYLRDHQPLAPDFARQQVVESGLPAGVTAGQAVSFSLSKLDLTSKGSPANQRVRVFLAQGEERRPIGTFPVTNGSSSVSFTAPANLTGSWEVGVAAEPSGTRVGFGGPVPAAPSIAGTVTDSGDDELAGVCVYLYTARNAPSASYATCTQADGTYYAAVTAGDYFVAVSDPANQHATTWLPEPVSVTAPVSGVDVVMDDLADARITGTVTDQASAGPASNVCVFAYPHGESAAASYATCTQSDGTYGLYGMEAGSYDVAFFDPTGEHNTQWWTGTAGGASSQAGATAVVLATGTSSATVDAVMSSETEGVVTGTVTNAGGTPLANVCVYLYTSPAGPAAYGTCTQADGTWYLAGVTPGADYRVGFADPQGTYATQWWTGTPGGSPTYAGATPIGPVSAGETTDDIDAVMQPIS